MNEKKFDFMYEIICDFCISLSSLSEADKLMLEGFRKSLRGWYESYKNRITKEMMFDE